MHVVPEDSGLWKFDQTADAANKASELLQKDLEQHHVFFNNDGFHNHIVHHILALYGTGAGPQALQRGYDNNAGYQRRVLKSHDRVIEDLKSWENAQKYLGKEQYYPDFLQFFQREIEAKGWQAVLNEYVFAGTESADDMLARLFAGFLHPLIQLMYGVEWAQPAIVAEALAQTCVHRNDLKEFLFASEKRANESANTPMPSIVSLLDAVYADQKLANSAQAGDSNKIRDGVLKRAKEEMLAITSQVKVCPEELEEKTVEMFNACVYAAAGAAIHPPKHIKFDFFLIHHVNSSPLFLAFNAEPSFSLESKIRLLEYKIRMDLVQYAARSAPALPLEAIVSYTPKEKPGEIKQASDLVSRIHNLHDDGHAIKLARAAGLCQNISKKYEDKDWMRIKGEDLWMKVHHMVVDSVEGPGPNWVRGAGLDEMWKDVPDQAKL